MVETRSTTRTRWRAALLALILLALGLRLHFALWEPQAPATSGDSALYVESAVLYLRSVLGACRAAFGPAATCGLALPADPDLRPFYDAHGFDPTTPGDVPTALAPNLLADLSGQRGGLTPLLYAGALWLLGPSADALRITQTALDTLTVLAAALLARRLLRMAGASPGAAAGLALLAGFAAAAYPPLIVAAGRLLQQPLAALFTTWGFYALALAAGRKTRRRLWAALALLVLAGFTVTVLRLLALLIIGLVMLFYLRCGDRRIARAAGGFLLAFALLSAALGLLFRGRPYGLGEWPLRLLTGLGTSEVGSVNLTAYLNTDGWHSDEHWITPFTTPSGQALLDALRRDPGPGPLLEQLLVNAYRLWLYPYNDYAQPFLLPYGTQVGLHQLLVMLAIIGLGAALAGGKRPAWLAAAYLAALTLAYAQYHIEARYHAPATPLLIALAGVGGWQIGVWLRRITQRGRPVPRLRGARWAVLAAYAAALLLAWAVYRSHDQSWRARRLESAHIRQVITLPPDAAARPGDPYLVLEIGPDAAVRVNGEPVNAALVGWEQALGIPLDGGQYATLLRLGAEAVAAFPHYVAWPVPAELLHAQQIEVTIAGDIWADALPDEPGVSFIPSPRRWDDARSMFLAIWSKGDRRIMTRFAWDGVGYTAEGAGEAVLPRIYLVWDSGPLRRPGE